MPGPNKYAAHASCARARRRLAACQRCRHGHAAHHAL